MSWFLWGSDMSRDLTNEAIKKYYKKQSEYEGKPLVAGDMHFDNGILKKVSTFQEALGLLYIYIYIFSVYKNKKIKKIKEFIKREQVDYY